MVTSKVDAEQRRRMVAEAAYFRAEKRGFSSGADDEFRDWLEAESEVDEQLRKLETQHFVERLEECLVIANRKLSTLRRKIAKLNAAAREECQKDVDRLAALRDRLRETQKEVRKPGEQAGRQLLQQAEKIRAEIGEIVSTGTRPQT